MEWCVRLSQADVRACHALAETEAERWKGKAEYYEGVVKNRHTGQLGELGLHRILESLLGMSVERPGSDRLPDLRLVGVGIEAKAYLPSGWKDKGAPVVAQKQLPLIRRRAQAICFLEVELLWVGLLGIRVDRNNVRRVTGAREYVADVRLRCWAEPKDFDGILPSEGRGRYRIAGNLWLPREQWRAPDELIQRLADRVERLRSRDSERPSSASPPRASRSASSAPSSSASSASTSR